MEKSNCQSCYMPMGSTDLHGTELNGAISADYCCYCRRDGKFTTEMTYEEAVKANIPWWKSEGETDEVAIERINAVFPHLKRWKV